MSAPESQISLWDDQRRSVLRLNGSFGVAEAEELRRAAIELSGRETDLHVDWSEVTQVDVSIVQVLCALRAAVNGSGRSISISPPGEAVLGYLQSAGLLSALEGTTNP